jgi:hypothetical protein
MGTKMVATATDLTTGPNQTVYSGSGLTVLGKFNLNWHLSKAFGVTGEVGYRMLNTGASTPTEIGLGSGLFQDTGGDYKALGLNLSGPVLGLGLLFNF